jgi:hypothetical protein
LIFADLISRFSLAVPFYRNAHPMRTMPWSKKIWVVMAAVGVLGALSLGIYGIVRIMSYYEVRSLVHIVTYLFVLNLCCSASQEKEIIKKMKEEGKKGK